MKTWFFVIQILLMNHLYAANPTAVFIPQLSHQDNGIVLTVLSSGCTKKADFSILVGDDASITIKRLRRDRCRAKARPIELHFSFEELGLEQPLHYL
jgi:hypothetical protein